MTTGIQIPKTELVTLTDMRVAELKERHFGLCQYCNMKGFKYIHFIDGNSSNNNSKNLRLICKSCVKKKRYWTSDAVFTIDGPKKIPEIIKSCFLSTEYCKNGMAGVGAGVRLRITHSGDDICIRILTSGSFSLSMYHARKIERSWKCSLMSIKTYKPRMGETFGKLGRAQFDDNFTVVWFLRKDRSAKYIGPIRKTIPRRLVIQLAGTSRGLCQICKERKFEHTHHIDGDPTNDSDSNLMPLCRPCHKKKHPHGYKEKLVVV
jgi:5-methylcytosine-specific restriction endonuclease McrA